MKENSILNSKQHTEEITIEFPNNSLIALIIGNHSANLSKLEKLIEVSINSFGNQFNITGKTEEIKLAKAKILSVSSQDLKMNFE